MLKAMDILHFRHGNGKTNFEENQAFAEEDVSLNNERHEWTWSPRTCSDGPLARQLFKKADHDHLEIDALALQL
jgi:hypothetical protein